MYPFPGFVNSMSIMLAVPVPKSGNPKSGAAANLISSLLSSSLVSVLTLTALQRSFILSDNIAHLSRAEMATPQESKSYYWP